jgi:hypothetical protein
MNWYCYRVCNFQYLEQEKKIREFHANPIPACIKSPNTVKQTSVLSIHPSPFQLEVDKRGMLKQQQLKQKVKTYLTSGGGGQSPPEEAIYIQ